MIAHFYIVCCYCLSIIQKGSLGRCYSGNRGDVSPGEYRHESTCLTLRSALCSSMQPLALGVTDSLNKPASEFQPCPLLLVYNNEPLALFNLFKMGNLIRLFIWMKWIQEMYAQYMDYSKSDNVSPGVLPSPLGGRESLLPTTT